MYIHNQIWMWVHSDSLSITITTDKRRETAGQYSLSFKSQLRIKNIAESFKINCHNILSGIFATLKVVFIYLVTTFIGGNILTE